MVLTGEKSLTLGDVNVDVRSRTMFKAAALALSATLGAAGLTLSGPATAGPYVRVGVALPLPAVAVAAPVVVRPPYVAYGVAPYYAPYYPYYGAAYVGPYVGFGFGRGFYGGYGYRGAYGYHGGYGVRAVGGHGYGYGGRR
jgi:hypothetical protein